MNLSVFDLLKVGIGPSSSHTVGPMIAARRFLLALDEKKLLHRISSVRVDLFGSLAMTGHGHGTNQAILLGLMGETPADLKMDAIADSLASVEKRGELRLLGKHTIKLTPGEHLHANKGAVLSSHPNGMTFAAIDENGQSLAVQSYFSIGGGFVLSAEEIALSVNAVEGGSEPFPIDSMAEMLHLCDKHQMGIADLTLANELHCRSREEIFDGLYGIWQVMDSCIEKGCAEQGVLPGGLAVRRRAYDLHRDLKARMESGNPDPLAVMGWISLFALAVNEQNAAGARIVTAPTNGAAGVIPAGAIGMLFKKNASISARGGLSGRDWRSLLDGSGRTNSRYGGKRASD